MAGEGEGEELVVLTDAADLAPGNSIGFALDLRSGKTVIVDGLPDENPSETMKRAENLATMQPDEKPYRPLVDFRYHGSNSHWSGRGQR